MALLKNLELGTASNKFIKDAEKSLADREPVALKMCHIYIY